MDQVLRPMSGLAVALVVLMVAVAPAKAGTLTVDFDDLTLSPESHWNGPDPSGVDVMGDYGPVRVGSFSSRGASFVNRYDLTYGSWNGFAYSNVTDNTTPGFMNQFSAAAGGGYDPGADNYGVAFGYDDLLPNLIDPDPFDPTSLANLNALPYFDLPDGYQIEGMQVTNTTYAAFTMLLGDQFSKKFGGASGNEADFFKLTAYGTDGAGKPLPGTAEFYLADYRFSDNSLDYVVTDWRFFDLSALSGARRIHFNLSSSDRGDFGMNTPATFAVDGIRLSSTSLNVVPEPSSLALMGAGLLGGGVVYRLRRRGRFSLHLEQSGPAGRSGEKNLIVSTTRSR